MSTPQSPFNPSRQVERIREILVGRQMAKIEQRLDRLETTASTGQAPVTESRLEQLRSHLHAQSQALTAEIGRIEHRVGTLEQTGSQAAGQPSAEPRLERLEAALAAEAKQRREETAALAARIQTAAEALGARISALPNEQTNALSSLRAELQATAATLHRRIEDQALRRAEDLRELTARIEQVAQQAAFGPAAGYPSSLAFDQRLVTWIQTWQDQLARYLQGREQQLIGHLREELQHMRDNQSRAVADLQQSKVDRAEWQERMARVAAVARALVESPALAHSS